MKLKNKKNNMELPYCVGYDDFSHQYLLEENDTTGNMRYYTISEEQYNWFESDRT